jgi:transposase-like protein
MDETEVMQEVVQPTRRRRHSKEFKAQAIRAAMQPNVSIAAVALLLSPEREHAPKLGGCTGRTGCG